VHYLSVHAHCTKYQVVVPRLSPLHLYWWTEKYRAHPAARIITATRSWIRTLDEASAMPLRFFNAYWEMLWRHLKPRTTAPVYARAPTRNPTSAQGSSESEGPLAYTYAGGAIR